MATPFVTTSNTTFAQNDAPFPVSGVNCYFLAYCDPPARRAAITTAKQMGATVIRAWAFLDVEGTDPNTLAFQSLQDGKIQINDGPNGLQRLDALIQTAEEFDIKLILPLVNHWKDFGGMPAYVNCFAPGADVTDFYRSPAIRAAYQDWLHHILTRRNTLTGRLYSEEPAIMAWELTNEARCQTKGGRELLLDWAREMSAFVKQRDSNHLLALGDEGHFYKKGRGHLYDGTYGVDWEANLAIENMDFGTCHYYPQDWGYADHLDHFTTRWMTDHFVAAARLNKPALLEEFGLKIGDKSVPTAEARNAWYAKWLNVVQETGIAGSLLWMLGNQLPETAKFTDPYAVYGQDELSAISTAIG